MFFKDFSKIYCNRAIIPKLIHHKMLNRSSVESNNSDIIMSDPITSLWNVHNERDHLWLTIPLHWKSWSRSITCCSKWKRKKSFKIHGSFPSSILYACIRSYVRRCKPMISSLQNAMTIPHSRIPTPINTRLSYGDGRNGYGCYRQILCIKVT